MKYSNSILSEESAARVREIILEAEKLRFMDPDQFNAPRSDGGWSIAQILVHLNFYSDYYLPLLERTSTGHSAGEYHSGWLGDYFTKLMEVDKTGKVVKKMKSPSNARPVDTNYSKDVLEKFIGDQQRLLNLLKNSKELDLSVRIPISISKLIRLKAGDALRFYVAHEERHMAQLRGVKKEQQQRTGELVN